VPSIGQVGSTAVVVQEAKLAAQDDFTGAPLTASDSELKSDMPDDPAVGDSRAKVIQ